jgi:hypothetical protein
MNPTQSAIGRQLSISKQGSGLDTLKVPSARKSKFKTPKRLGRETIYADAYKTHESSFMKKTPTSISIEEKKSSMAKLGDMRMRETPYQRVANLEMRKFSFRESSNEKAQKPPRVSRIRDICKRHLVL